MIVKSVHSLTIAAYSAMATPGDNPSIPGLAHIRQPSQTQTIEAFEAEYHAQQEQKPADITAPVALSRGYVSAHVERFNHLCQTHGVVNDFSYTESADPKGWSVVLRFGFGLLGAEGRVEQFELEEKGPFVNKKEAKAAVSERGSIVLLEAAEKRAQEKKANASPSPAMEAMAGPPSGEPARDASAVTENWIGLLLEYSSATGTPPPQFQDFSIGSRFACECAFAPRASQPFGTREELFPNKKSAKTNAAREAVEWLRSQGMMPERGHPSKKKFRAANAPAPPPQPPPSVLAGLSGGPVGPMPVGGNGNGSGSGSESEGAVARGQMGKERSYGEQVMAFCPTVGCMQPEYRLAQDARVPGFWSGAAFFPHDPLIAKNGPVAEIRNVWGKKTARELCAKGVLAHLKAVAARRAEEAKRLGLGA
ncbi:uncharacterized protein K452DRAFT_289380 [Aplosporella prunicola CBS 121167]|uniref:DRBM domain-containing protein n=1 Tax=Aplosporella prunicola CBS 121167 TaxID=1176127 RepID=A0A6A6B769_9PEZI|nr:uncharacterized protein K452DRAFT_289380 [Aplosporella prunicola CBS 121167]KAF2139992.1 hypothetical protein K452DRAFT_289380 [Aplosporella prunicola CBS 121167]